MVGRVERAPNGSRIVHHEPRSVPFRPAAPSRFFFDVHAHVERTLGAVPKVFHDLVGDLVHVDVYPVPPRQERPWWTLVTNGVSGAPMRVPEEAGGPDLTHAELCLQLPRDWPVFEPDRAWPRHVWPLVLLGELGRFPHALDAWLSPGSTVANGIPAEPFVPGTRWAGAMIERPGMLPRAFRTLRARGSRIEFLAIVPLTAAELDLARTIDADAFRDRLRAAGVTHVVDPDRPSVAGS